MVNLVNSQNCLLNGCFCLNESTLYSLICTKKLNTTQFPFLNFYPFVKQNISVQIINQNYSHLPQYIFNNSNKLVISLDLSHCQIETIHVNSFKSISNLDSLILAYNKLKRIDNIFNSLINLKKLILNNNEIKQISNDLCCLINLNILILSSNVIRSIGNFDFSCLSKLKLLSLNQNHIDYIQNVNMGSLGDMRELVLSENGLTVVKKFQAPPTIFYMKFNDNKLESLCEIISIQMANQIIYFDFSFNYLSQIDCVDFNEMSSMESLVMQFNMIRSIDFIDFRRLKNLVYLNFAHNKLEEIKNLDLRNASKIQDIIFR